ncbi:MAG TPA: hypothetical protein VHT30_05485 [Acidimicrobiales bacterium]|nr:hypothetical protein [Acidimicrobiales bacterium]
MAARAQLGHGMWITLRAARIGRRRQTPPIAPSPSPLLCGDLFTQLGDGPALTYDEILSPAAQAEDVFAYSCLAPSAPATIDRLAALEPTTLAVMHGSSFSGDCRSALSDLASAHRARIAAATI